MMFDAEFQQQCVTIPIHKPALLSFNGETKICVDQEMYIF